jgi:thioredoxin-dependent peroxiredoxin
MYVCVKGISMSERTGIVFSNGNPLTLLGQELKVGDMAPEFVVANHELKPVKLSSLKGKVVIVSSVPSLDTQVCHLETVRFNAEAKKVASDIKFVTISMDLPFAQKRWCEETSTKNVQVLSDYKEASFGMAYGVLIKELRLLARTIFIIDRTGKISYIQYVKETSEEPNYEEVLEAIKKTA